MTKVYSVEVLLCATAYIIANSEAEAATLAQEAFANPNDASVSSRTYFGDVPAAEYAFDGDLLDEDLPQLSLSPALTFWGAASLVDKLNPADITADSLEEVYDDSEGDEDDGLTEAQSSALKSRFKAYFATSGYPTSIGAMTDPALQSLADENPNEWAEACEEWETYDLTPAEAALTVKLERAELDSEIEAIQGNISAIEYGGNTGTRERAPVALARLRADLTALRAKRQALPD